MTNLKLKLSSFSPLKKDRVYIIGVSGGPDSMFLLDRMKNEYEIVVAHVNYQKRETSRIDENLVRNYCESHKIKFFSINANYDKYEMKNFQSLARKIRYDFFSSICSVISANENKRTAVAVAHNEEDLIETYLMQKDRNSIVQKWGISFKSFWNGFEVYRPILSFKKYEILLYLNLNNIKYSIDITNEQNIYKRNLVRKKVFCLSAKERVSILEEIENENFKLLNLLKFLDEKLEMIIFNHKLELNSFWEKLDIELKKRVIYHWINKFSGDYFVSRKKNILLELIKQFDCDSKKIEFKFKNGVKIEKIKKAAFISWI